MVHAYTISLAFLGNEGAAHSLRQATLHRVLNELEYYQQFIDEEDMNESSRQIKFTVLNYKKVHPEDRKMIPVKEIYIKSKLTGSNLPLTGSIYPWAESVEIHALPDLLCNTVSIMTGDYCRSMVHYKNKTSDEIGCSLYVYFMIKVDHISHYCSPKKTVCTPPRSTNFTP